MFNMHNTEGFSQADLDLMNAAVTQLMNDGIGEKNAGDIVNNNWRPTGNTVASLAARCPRNN